MGSALRPFIVIGLLRSPVAPEDLERQGDLF